MALEAAANEPADALITRSVTHFAQAATRFSFTLLRPRGFLKRMPRWARPPNSLKPPAAVKAAAARLARQDGVSLNQRIASAVAQKAN